ncbi:MAG: response regulator [Bacteroidia bacterium]|nr:response regulator [Bacteroidia bacterium]
MTESQNQTSSNGPQLLDAGLKVLLVDDNKVNQFLGRRILNNLGVHSIEVAGSGQEALEKTKNHSFDVVLTDVEMPGMNGYELSRQLRAEENPGQRLTIIALTANASDEDRESAVKAGIDDYLTKPYSPHDLFEILKKNISGKRNFVLEDLKENFSGGIEKLYAVFNNNTNDIEQFLRMLHQQMPELITAVREGLAELNREKAFQAAHKLKSPVKMLMPSLFAQNYSSFTEQMKESEDLVTSTQEFNNLEKDLESLLVLINIELEKICR